MEVLFNSISYWFSGGDGGGGEEEGAGAGACFAWQSNALLQTMHMGQ